MNLAGAVSTSLLNCRFFGRDAPLNVDRQASIRELSTEANTSKHPLAPEHKKQKKAFDWGWGD